jgi:hydroxylaminobenzene mutase
MKTDDRLVFQGLLLFLFALLTGLLLVAGPSFVVNPRGVLAGHLEGAMNGMFLILVGLFVNRIQWSALQARICRGALLYSCFANWFFTTLGGILGVSEATPLAGAGHHASPAAEQLILAGLVTVAITIIVAVSLLLAGVRRALSNSPA